MLRVVAGGLALIMFGFLFSSFGLLRSSVEAQSLPSLYLEDLVLYETAVDYSTDLILSEIPDSEFAGFIINVTVPSFLEIVTASVNPEFALSQVIVDDSRTSVKLGGADLGGVFLAGDVDVVLATLTLTGVDLGFGSPVVSVTNLDDGNGDVIVVDIVAASFAVKLLPIMPGQTVPVVDLNGDGLYEDMNGNLRRDFADIVIFFLSIDSPVVQDNIFIFDYDANGVVNMADVQEMFNQLVRME